MHLVNTHRKLSGVFACLAATALGCVELRYADGGADSPEVQQPAEVIDATPVADVPDPLDLSASDVRDAPEVFDASDVRDAAEVFDHSDARDASEVFDVSDTGDAATRRDAADVAVLGDVAPTAVTLENATASFSQVEYEVSRAIDGSSTDRQGWGIGAASGGPVNEETAVFEFALNTPGSPTGTRVTITMVNSAALFRLMRFRFSVTTALRTMFADGMQSGGNLGSPSIWIVPTRVSATAMNGSALTERDGILTAAGSTISPVYTVRLDTSASRLTGLRLETFRNTATPGDGPGTGTMASAHPGNFILTEIEVSASPLP